MHALPQPAQDALIAVFVNAQAQHTTGRAHHEERDRLQQ
jgi:hypothetical protein